MNISESLLLLKQGYLTGLQTTYFIQYAAKTHEFSDQLLVCYDVLAARADSLACLLNRACLAPALKLR